MRRSLRLEGGTIEPHLEPVMFLPPEIVAEVHGHHGAGAGCPSSLGLTRSCSLPPGPHWASPGLLPPHGTCSLPHRASQALTGPHQTFTRLKAPPHISPGPRQAYSEIHQKALPAEGSRRCLGPVGLLASLQAGPLGPPWPLGPLVPPSPHPPQHITLKHQLEGQHFMDVDKCTLCCF